MDVIKSRKTSSGSEAEAAAHAVRCFYPEYGEYLVVYRDFRTAGALCGSLPWRQCRGADPLGLFLDQRRCTARYHVLRFHIAHIRNEYK